MGTTCTQLTVLSFPMGTTLSPGDYISINSTFAAVHAEPEPSTFVLALIGLALVPAVRRRRCAARPENAATEPAEIQGSPRVKRARGDVP